MIIYFVITNLWGGGAQKAILKLAETLQKSINEVAVITLEAGSAYEIPPGIRVLSLEAQSKKWGRWFSRRLAAYKLKSLLKKLKPADLVISTLPYADEVVFLAGIRQHVARVANTLGMELGRMREKSRLRSYLRYRKYQRIYSCPQLIAVSEGVAEDLRGSLHIRNPILVLPNIIEKNDLRLLSACHSDAFKFEAKSYILHAARFSPQKRHDLLLDVWMEWTEGPPLVLLTNPTQKLELMIRERNLSHRVFIAGFQKNPYPWYQRAALTVLCSDYEGLPNVLLESLACGTPVVSTNCPSGPSEILRDYPTCLVPCNDKKSLLKALKRIWESPPSVENYDFSKYSSESVIETLESLALKLRA